jgi:hypothetical protein
MYQGVWGIAERRPMRATVLRTDGDRLEIQPAELNLPRWIHVTEIVPPAPLPITVKPFNYQRALDRYSHLAAERSAQLEADRIYYAIPCSWTDAGREIERSRRAYDRAAHHVARLEAMVRGEQPAPFVVPGPMLALPAMFRSMFAWMTLERWRNEGKPKYQPTADELAGACQDCQNDKPYCTCPTEPIEPETRGYLPWGMVAR